MTSKPEDEINPEALRARVAALLTTPPSPIEDATVTANRRIWNRASEQERRRMLKDCGWL